MIKKFVTLAAIFFISSTSNAALLAYTDRAAWQTAAGGGGGDLFENFDSFTNNTFYGSGIAGNPYTSGINGSLTAGFLTLDVINGYDDSSWRTETSTTRSDIPGVDNSPYAITIGYNFCCNKGDTLMSFGDVSAIGFDYGLGTYSTSSGFLTTNLGDSVVLDRLNPDGSRKLGVFFLGLLYTEGESFTSLEWVPETSNGAFGFGMDNVEAYSTVSPNPVPVPAAVWLFGTVLIGLVGFSKRRKVA